MTQYAPPITITDLPEATRLAREVNETGKACLVRLGGAVVRISPVRRRRAPVGKQPSPEAIEAALAAAGSWEGLVDAEKFKRNRRELQIDDKLFRSF